MLRRPPTSIELKLDDLSEYENLRREQESKDSAKPGKSYNEVPKWQPGQRPVKEVYERIGYTPPSYSYRSDTRSPVY